MDNNVALLAEIARLTGKPPTFKEWRTLHDAEKAYWLSVIEKRCNQCKEVKPLDQFKKDSRYAYGRNGNCKACNNQLSQDIRSINRACTDMVIPKEKKCTKCGVTKLASEFYEDHGCSDWLYPSCKACGKDWYENGGGRERYQQWHQQWWENGGREARRVYKANRLASDDEFKLALYIRNQIQRGLCGIVKTSSRSNTLGYSWAKLREHIESLFEPGMSWANQGDWHVGHRIAIAAFRLTDPDGSENKHVVQACWALWNLKPQWGTENLKQGQRVLKEDLNTAPHWILEQVDFDSLIVVDKP